MTHTPPRYLALGDSMSIDFYTGVTGGGAAAQFRARLGAAWAFEDETFDGAQMADVPRERPADLITLTIGGNDLLAARERYLREGLALFAEEHAALLKDLRAANPEAFLIVGNIYAPQTPLSTEEARALDAANACVEENARRLDAALADIRGAFAGHEQTYLCGDIEPTLEGASVIAGLFEQAWREHG